MQATITIPEGAKCLLKAGQTVDFGMPFLEKKSTMTVTLEAASALGIAPSKIFNHLRKFVGDTINVGDLLGINKGLLSTKKIKSKFAGMIKEIDHTTGNIIIVAAGDSDMIQKIFFRGEITAVHKQAITVELKKGREFPLQKMTTDFGGKVSYIENGLDGKIFFAETITGYLQLKAEAVGAAGFITLTRLNEETDLPSAQLKNIADSKKILDLQLPYCLISREHSTIYFYE